MAVKHYYILCQFIAVLHLGLIAALIPLHYISLNSIVSCWILIYLLVRLCFLSLSVLHSDSTLPPAVFTPSMFRLMMVTLTKWNRTPPLLHYHTLVS